MILRTPCTLETLRMTSILSWDVRAHSRHIHICSYRVESTTARTNCLSFVYICNHISWYVLIFVVYIFIFLLYFAIFGTSGPPNPISGTSSRDILGLPVPHRCTIPEPKLSKTSNGGRFAPRCHPLGRLQLKQGVISFFYIMLYNCIVFWTTVHNICEMFYDV